MLTKSENNKRIAKNSLLLYIRTIISTIISLYTSRVILQALGVEDYGIYNVVAGVVSMLGFLNTSMSGATSRFITYEIGKGNFKSINETFCTAFNVHIILAVIVILIAESLGPWFINNKLVIPEHRLSVANWVFQISLLSAAIGIIQVPYNAMIIAKEKFDVFAYVEIAHVLLKLFVTYLLMVLPGTKLIIYSILLTLVTIIISITYRIYCIRNFKECNIHFIWKKDLLKPMVAFSVWDLYGNGCVIISNQGVNFILNVFFGVLLNAANGIATMVGGATRSFAMSVITAFRPQIIKAYAQNNIEQLNKLTLSSIKYTLILYSFILFPLCIEIKTVLSYWLTVVPNYSAEFCVYLLISSAFIFVGNIAAIIIHATGNIKRLSFISGSLFIINLPLIYIGLKISPIPELAYIVMLFTSILNMFCNLLIAKKQVKQLCLVKIIKLFIKVLIIALISIIPVFHIHLKMELSFFRLIVVVMSYMFIMSLISYFFLLEQQERSTIIRRLIKK